MTGRDLHAFLPVVAYCALIFALSAQTSLPQPPGSDKLAHAIAYAIMGALCVRALMMATAWRALAVIGAAVLFSVLYGVSDEWHQSFVSGRYASVMDVVADGVGAAIGAPIALYAARFTSWRGS